MSSQSKKNTFYGAAALLTVTTIVVKIIGAIYKIPLTALLPDEAYGDFNAAYNIYTFFLTISTAGLPVAISRMVSESNARGRYNNAQRILYVAFQPSWCWVLPAAASSSLGQTPWRGS